MDFMAGLSSGILSVLSFAMFAACALKVFQMDATLTEIKDLLAMIKVNSSQPPISLPLTTPAPPQSTQSGEEMLRALSLELDRPLNPTSIELGQKP
jgi:hypothetical protein